MQSRYYDNDVHPTTEDMSTGCSSSIPNTLRLLIDTVILKGKKTADTQKFSRKCVAIEHAIITTERPRSFLSPIQVGLGVHLHKGYTSKSLLEILSNLGFCSSYNEAVRYQSYVTQYCPPEIDTHAHLRYVFDNADYNLHTLDGHGTFHAMDSQCVCVTPIVQFMWINL